MNTSEEGSKGGSEEQLQVCEPNNLISENGAGCSVRIEQRPSRESNHYPWRETQRVAFSCLERNRPCSAHGKLWGVAVSAGLGLIMACGGKGVWDYIEFMECFKVIVGA